MLDIFEISPIDEQDVETIKQGERRGLMVCIFGTIIVC